MAESNAAGGKGVFISEKCFGADYAQAQTAVTVITPVSGKKLIIKQVYVSTDAVDVNVTLEFADSEKVVFKLYTTKTNTAAGNFVCGEGAVDEVLSLTCGAATFVSVAYDEK